MDYCVIRQLKQFKVHKPRYSEKFRTYDKPMTSLFSQADFSYHLDKSFKIYAGLGLIKV